MDDPPPPYQLSIHHQDQYSPTKRRRLSTEGNHRSTQTQTPEKQRVRNAGPRLNVVTNFSKPPALADRAASYEKRVKQDWQAGIASITNIKAAIKSRETKGSDDAKRLGDGILPARHASKPSDGSISLKSRVNSLKRSTSRIAELSPSDRLVNIGLSITPTTVDRCVIGQDQFSARSRGLTVTQDIAGDVRSVAPSIVVTPAGEQAPWSPGDNEDNISANTGPSPSVYSQAWTTPHAAAWISEAPPLPRIPPEALTSKQAIGCISGDALNSNPQRKNLSVYTAFEEDEFYIPIRRPESGESQLRILERSSTDSSATKRHSQGWWNTITSPLWPRSPLSIPQSLRIGKQNIKVSNESPQDHSLKKQSPSDDSVTEILEYRKSWMSSPNEPIRNSEAVDVDWSENISSPQPMVVEDPLPPEGFGLAAEYYQACWHDQNSPTAYFPCQNHTCGPDKGLNLEHTKDEPVAEDSKGLADVENLDKDVARDSKGHSIDDTNSEEKGSFHQTPGNRFSAAFSAAMNSKRRPVSEATTIEDLDATPVVKDAHVAPVIRGVAPMNATGPEVASRGPPPASKENEPSSSEPPKPRSLEPSALPSGDLGAPSQSQERLTPNFQRGLGLSNREELIRETGQTHNIRISNEQVSSPAFATPTAQEHIQKLSKGTDSPKNVSERPLPSRGDSLVHVMSQSPPSSEKPRKHMIAILPPGHPLNKSPTPVPAANDRPAQSLDPSMQARGLCLGHATYQRPSDRNPYDQRDCADSRKSKGVSLYPPHRGNVDRGHRVKAEKYEEASPRRKWGGLTALKAFFARGPRQGGEKQPISKRKKWIIIAIATGLIFMIILILILTMTLHRKGDDQEIQTQWLNITGFPPVPTGVSTIVQPDAVRESSGCVEPSTMWSCALPKEQQDAVSPNDADQPNFRVEIRFRNDSSLNTIGTSNSTFARRDITSKPLSAKAFIRSRILHARDSFTNLLFTPMPAAPGKEDQAFLGQNTDGNSAPFEGEKTPFFMSFMNADKLPSRLARRAQPEPTATSSVASSTNSSEPFPDLTSNIPKPDVRPDGTAAPANLLPYPSAQPLRLYDRGKNTEHYGFYTYFDRSIFLKSTELFNSSNVGAVPSDKNGGSEEEAATVRCTWTQTRFLVQIWTNQGTGAQLLSTSNSKNSSESLKRSETLSESSANNFLRPGSFPYPVSITLDRHGGDIKSKEIFCYGIDERQRVIDSQKKIQLENRAFGGKLVNPALGPFGEVKVSKEDSGPGGIDGGTGGCGCLWRNWQGAGAS